MTNRFQPSLGTLISTETRPGTALAPVLFEPPWPLVERPEIWIAAVGDPEWGGAQVLVSEDDDDYRCYVGQLSSGMTMGTLLDAIPAALAHRAYDEVRFRVRLHGTRELPAATPAQAVARMTDTLLIDEDGRTEIIATTMTRLVGSEDGNHVYECSGPLIRGGYGTGREIGWDLAGYLVGTRFVRLDREIFRFVYEVRHIGQRLWFKLAAQNPYADLDATTDPQDVEPVAIDVQGIFYQRDPRRWL